MKLFHYQNINNLARDLEFILHGKIWFSSYQYLNDPNEGYSIVKHIDNIWTKFIYSSRPELDYSGYISRLNNEYEMVASLAKEYSGIYCLTESVQDELMWSYYGGSHSGICLEYEFNKIEELNITRVNKYLKININDTVLIKVKYSPRINTIPFGLFTELNNPSIYKTLFSRKSTQWKHEKEFRIITLFYGAYNYNKACLKAIHFGLRTPHNLKSKVMDYLKDLNIDFYDVANYKNTFKLNPYQIVQIRTQSKMLDFTLEFSESDFRIYRIEKNMIQIRKRAIEVNRFDDTTRLHAEKIEHSTEILEKKMFCINLLKMGDGFIIMNAQKTELDSLSGYEVIAFDKKKETKLYNIILFEEKKIYYWIVSYTDVNDSNNFKLVKTIINSFKRKR